MRLKSLETAVNSRIGKDVKLRLYGSREGSMVIDIYINGSRLWRGQFVNSLYLNTDDASPANIQRLINSYLTSRSGI